MPVQYKDTIYRAISTAKDLVVVTDTGGDILYVNEAVEKTTGYKLKELLGRNCRIFKSGAHHHDFYDQLWQTLANGESYSAIFINKCKDDTTYYEDKTISPVYDGGRLTHFISIGKAISKQTSYLDRLSDTINHDQMTGISNRAHFFQRLQQESTQASRRGEEFAVFAIDLDYFKKINDTLGHQIGDEVLITVAKRLQESVREGDTCARIGGDEFAVLLQNTGEIASIASIAQKIIQAVSASMEIQGYQLYVSCSVGIGIYPKDGEDHETLYKHADNAMYLAKANRPGRFSFFQHEMTRETELRLRLEQDVKRAIERDELKILFQPQMDLKTGRFVGAEALLRWEHPELGTFTPDILIPVLEEAGMIREVGEWVITGACDQIAALAAQGLDCDISVNISGHQLIQRDFVERIENLLSSRKCHNLQLEITEELLIGDMVRSIDKLHGLERLGIKVCLDDFGTHHASLTHLKRSHIKILKINKDFIQQIPGNSETEAVIDSIIAIAHSMDMRVAAVGVENEGQLEYLYEHGCDLVQGYMFSGPVGGDHLAELINEPSVLLKSIE